MPHSWKFIENPVRLHAWSWILCERGRGILRSGRDFETFAACMLDAHRRGFGIRDGFDVIRERRREPRVLPLASDTAALFPSPRLPC